MKKIVIIVALVCGAWQQADAQYVSKVWVSDQKDGTYINPIIHADYSDPDVCAVGDDFYMTASSFGCTPGLPILHSKDLVNWRLANYALKEIEPTIFFNAPQHGKGVWAPSIRYHNGEFFIYWGDPDWGIFMVKTKDPLGEWEKPVLVKAGKGMIDPTPLWGSNAIMLVVGTMLYGVFLLFSGATLLQGLLCLWLFNIMIVNWNGMSYLTAIKDYRGILCSFAAAIGVACLCALAALALGLPPVEGLLASIALGYGVMLAWDVVLLYRYFPQSDRSPWLFLRWLDQFMPLALTGLFTNLGLFAHLVIIWAGPIGVQVKGLFYGAPYHDVPALIAFLTILVTSVNFVVSVEVNFYPRYRDYYSLFNDGGVVGDIVVAEEEMLATLNRELRFCALKQLFVTAAVISLETTVLSALPLGFNNLMHGYFRTLCVGYGLYAVGNTVLLILLYFTDYKGAVLASGLFAGVAGLATAVSLLLPQQFYGFGFLLGAAVFFIVALLRLDTYTANLPYRILSQQPIVATDKTGWFAELGRVLDRVEQRYEDKRVGGEPRSAFERMVVRLYQKHWGGSDDR